MALLSIRTPEYRVGILDRQLGASRTRDLDLNRASSGTLELAGLAAESRPPGQEESMKTIALGCLVALSFLALPQVGHAQAPAGPTGPTPPAANDRRAVQALAGVVRSNIVSSAEAMPEDKFGFAPSEGEFTGVRSFRQQLKHLAATNYILAAAALGRDPPPGAGDESGPENVRTKEEVLAYLGGSFAALDSAIAAIGDPAIPVRSSPISPLRGESLSRLALIAEALIHAYDHYGQMVVYLRMNDVVPPASRK
jgi:uncharacterized damage-inducible protein DinB